MSGIWNVRMLLVGGLLLAPIAAASDFELSVMAGGTVPLLADSGGLVGDSVPDGQSKVSPLVFVDVETPISAFEAGPTLAVGAEYGSGPGESLDIEKPETFRSLSVRVGLSQPLSRKLYFSLYVDAGFQTRFEGDSTPRDRAPRWAGAGVRFKGFASELAITLNADQRLSSTADLPRSPLTATLAYQPTVEIRGKVPIYQAGGKLAGGKISLYVHAILGMDWSTRSPQLTGGRHDVVTAGVVMGI